MRTEWRRALYGCTIFTSALLLFLVQPMMARAILPWYGGSAGVWTTSMLFFQALLLAGYWYAHRASALGSRSQAALHGTLLAVSLLLLPVIPAARWKPAASSDPVFGILVLLTVTVGLPYLLLSTTTPLVQSWYARETGRSPYRLFAVSNFASLAALLSYPFAIEPAMPLRTQLVIWSVCYAGFAVLCGVSALASMGRKQIPRDECGAPWKDRLTWMVLAACPSALWLATANQVSQSVAPMPFLWILPLGIYLLTLILCFDRDGWYSPSHYKVLVPLALVAGSIALSQQWTAPLWRTIALLMSALFVCSMFCHGELARRKPEPRQLTSFYLMVAVGGALGGAFVALAAPRLLSGYFELQIVLICCLVLVFGILFGYNRPSHLIRLAAVALIGAGLGLHFRGTASGHVLRERNFYGAVEVADGKGPGALRTLYHGSIIHGSQFLAPERSRIATGYYGESSGVGLALKHRARPGRRVGVVGLGAGTLATYGRPGDTFRFYEINPMVIDIAQRHFGFLKEAQARTEMVLGDARLTLDAEPPQGYDVLVVDAFSGDSIPVHLLTREAFALYFRHLRPDGILAVHLTNRYIDLPPVVAAAVKTFDRRSLIVRAEGDGKAIYTTTWALVASDPDVALAAAADHSRPTRTVPLWTDDYSNLFRLLR